MNIFSLRGRKMKLLQPIVYNFALATEGPWKIKKKDGILSLLNKLIGISSHSTRVEHTELVYIRFCIKIWIYHPCWERTYPQNNNSNQLGFFLFLGYKIILSVCLILNMLLMYIGGFISLPPVSSYGGFRLIYFILNPELSIYLSK